MRAKKTFGGLFFKPRACVNRVPFECVVHIEPISVFGATNIVNYFCIVPFLLLKGCVFTFFILVVYLSVVYWLPDEKFACFCLMAECMYCSGNGFAAGWIFLTATEQNFIFRRKTGLERMKTISFFGKRTLTIAPNHPSSENRMRLKKMNFLSKNPISTYWRFFVQKLRVCWG